MALFYVLLKETLKGEFTDFEEARDYAASLGSDALISVEDGTGIAGSLYAEGVRLSFSQNAQLAGRGSNNVFVFGGAAESDAGDAEIEVAGSAMTNVWLFGGNAKGTWEGDAKLSVFDAEIGGTRSAIYGGGNAAETIGDISLSVVRSTVTAIYGGGRTGEVVGSARISVSDSEITGSIYGAGYNADLSGDLVLTLSNSTVGGDVVIAGNRGGVVSGTSSVVLSDTAIAGALTGSGLTELLVAKASRIEGEVTGVVSLTLDALTDPGVYLAASKVALNDMTILIDEAAQTGDYIFVDGIDSNLLNLTFRSGEEVIAELSLYRGDNQVIEISDEVAWSVTYSEGTLGMTVVNGEMVETPFHLEETSNGRTMLSSYYETIDEAAAAANGSRMAVATLLINGDAEGDFVLNADETILNGATITGSLTTVDGDSQRTGDTLIQLNNSNVTGDIAGGVRGEGGSSVLLYGGTIGGAVYGAGDRGADTTFIQINDGAVGENITDKGGAIVTLAGGGRSGIVTGDTVIQITGGTVRGGIYGGGVEEEANVGGNVVIDIENGYLGGISGSGDETVYYQSNVYGGGKGANTVEGDANIDIRNGVILGSVYGAGEAGRVNGAVNIDISYGQIRYNVYGAGATGHAGVGGDVNISIVGGILGGVTLDEDGNEVFDSGNIYGGSRSRCWVDGDVIISVEGGTVFGSIYGGSHFGTDNITVSGGIVRGGLYGSCDGGKGVTITVNGGQIGEGITDAGGAVPVICGTGLTYGNLNGDVEITLNGGTIRGGIYAGGTVNGVGIKGNTAITIGECFLGGVSGEGDSVVYYQSNVCGGGKGANIVSGDSAITLAGGTVVGSVFGGGEAGRVEGDVAITVESGWIRGDVFGGGDTGFAGVGGNVTITIEGGLFGGLMEIDGVGTYDCGNIYGCGRGGNYIDENVEITVNAGTIYGSVYGGSRFGENTIAIEGGEIYGAVFGTAKGAGIHSEIIVRDGVIGAANGDAAAGAIYGGAEQDEGLASGDVEITIVGGTVNGTVYGGARGNTAVESAAIIVAGGTIAGSVYGAGENGGVNGNVLIVFLGEGYSPVGASAEGGTPEESTEAELTEEPAEETVAEEVSLPEIAGDVIGAGAADTASVGGSVLIGLTSGTIAGSVRATAGAAVGGDVSIVLFNMTVGGGVYGGDETTVAGETELKVRERVIVAGDVVEFDRILLAIDSYLQAAQIDADAYSISIDADTGNGFYVLAEGVVAGEGVEVSVLLDDETLGTVTLSDEIYDAAFVVDDITYTLSVNGGRLSLKVSDGTTPAYADINGDLFADVLLVHEIGYTGAWTIQSDLLPTWLDLSTIEGNYSVLDTGSLSGDKASADILLYDAATHVTGAWITDEYGAVTGWETIATFDDDVDVIGAADFDGDLRTDLLLSINGEYGTFLTGGAAWNRLGAAEEFAAATIGDFNGDGCADLLLGDGSSYKVWFVNARQRITEVEITGLEGEILGSGDFYGAGSDTILVSADNQLKVASFDEEYNVVWGETGINAEGFTVERIADFNGDNVSDILLRSGAGDIGAMILGSEGYEWHYFGSVGSEWTSTVAGI